MKVAYIIHSLDPFAGASKALIPLFDQLIQNGIEPYLITPSEGLIPDEWIDERVPVFRLNFRSCTYPPIRNFKDTLLFPLRTIGRAILAYWASHQLALIIRKEHIDVVHSNSSVVSIGRDAAIKANIPHIYHFREYGDKDFNLHYIPSWKHFHAQAQTSFNVCITKGIKEHHFSKDDPNTMVIYDGVMAQKKAPEFKPHTNYFLIAGRVEAAKGLDFALVGYKLYKEQCTKPLKLKIAGRENDPLYSKKIHEYIADNHLQDYIEFLGNRSDLDTLMQEATATIIASEFEGFGFVMAEAMFNGCLVIGRDTAGTKEQFDNGLKLCQQEIGLRYDTPQKLAQCMLRAEKASASEWTAMKQCAFQTVNTQYTTEHQIQQLIQIYKQI